jgi:prepilin-type N-terminal cleavage/methylation domain-containing protein
LVHPRSSKISRRRSTAFTLFELLVTLAIITILIAILLAGISRIRGNAKSAVCLSQLHQIATALIAYTRDNTERFPDPAASQASWEQMIGNYVLTPSLFNCPGDEEIYPVVGSSYDWRDTGVDQTTLAGKLCVGLKCPNPVLAFDALPGWHAKQKMNAARMDGSAATMDQGECIGDLQKSIR